MQNINPTYLYWEIVAQNTFAFFGAKCRLYTHLMQNASPTNFWHKMPHFKNKLKVLYTFWPNHQTYTHFWNKMGVTFYHSGMSIIWCKRYTCSVQISYIMQDLHTSSTNCVSEGIMHILCRFCKTLLQNWDMNTFGTKCMFSTHYKIQALNTFWK